MVLDQANTDQRGAARFPLMRDVRYKICSRKSIEESGFGSTINMSSSGILLSTDRPLRPGMRLELSISWPAELNGKVPLQFIARGRVVRSTAAAAALEIHQREFRTLRQTAIGRD